MSERTDDPTFKANDPAINEVYGKDTFSFGGHIYETTGGSTFLHGGESNGRSSTEPASAQQGKSSPQENSPANNHISPGNLDASVTSYNGVMVDARDNGGYHFNQNGRIYYKKGDILYGAEQIPGGNYTVAEVPESEAKGIIAKDILDNGKSLYARNRIYYLHGDTVYGFNQKADGTTEAYAVSPHEDADIYKVAHSKGRSMPTAETPLISPTDALGAGLAKAGITAARTTGNLLSRAGSAALAGGMEIIQDVATQAATNPIYKQATNWYNMQQ